MDINTKFNQAIQDVITELQIKNYQKVIESTFEIASMIKSGGHGPTVFAAIMENLDIQIKANLGQDVHEQFKHVMKNWKLYSNHSMILIA